MKYYVLKNSTGDDIGKEYPQTDGMCAEYRSSLPNSISFLPNLELPNFEPNLDYFILDKKANLTDFISTGLINATGFIMNDKAKTIFEKFNLMPHKFFPARILNKNKFVSNYYWLHLCLDYSNLIDYRKSQFILKKMPPWNIPNWDYQIEPIKVDSKEGLTAIWKQNNSKQIYPVVLYLNDKFEKKLSLFAFKHFGDSVIISEYLKTALEENKVTGIEMLEVSYPVHFE